MGPADRRRAGPRAHNGAVPAWQTYLAEARLLAGEVGPAQGLIERAIQLAEKRKERGFLAHAHRVAAEIARGSGHLAAARRHYETAIALSSARGMSRLVDD